MGKSLGLAIPERTKPTKEAFDVRPKKVEAWIAALPMGNVGEAVRLVYTALKESNRIACAAADRTAMLESMREPLHTVTAHLRKHYATAAFPLPEKNEKVAALTRELYRQLAIGYKIAIEDTATKSFLFTDNKALTLLIHRAIAYLSRSLVSAFEVYAPYPSGTWRELHLLHSFAEEHKLHLTPVSDRYHRIVRKTTISAEYKRILLLERASPYRMRRGEAERVYTNLERWSHLCDLQERTPSPPNHGHFAVNVDSDDPATYWVLAQDNCALTGCRTLVTERLGAVLREEIENAEDEKITTLTGIDTSTPTLSQDLMRRLMLSWGVMPKRSFSRVAKTDSIRVAMGMRTTHHYVKESRRPPEPRVETQATPAAPRGDESGMFETRARFESIPIDNLSVSEPQADVWQLVYPSYNPEFDKVAFDTQGQPKPESKPAPPAKAERDYTNYLWQVVNESAGGCCLVSVDKVASEVLVGEIIGLRQAHGEHDKWGVGVIRWMKIGADRRMELGIQMLAPDAAPAGVKPMGGSDRAVTYQRGFVLPELRAIGQPATVITPPLPYRVGTNVLLKFSDGERHVRLTKLIENTGLFAQFQFSFVGPEGRTEDAGDVSGEYDFSSVWSSL
ncbi:MAG: hypothetical protein AMJ69_05025 [Gammaproteobacteria bacterium SG8_47]|nr:MAG: hypothetical protein AMJ69_05025 [Gammaproteobacteria bacterium SG8_47]